MKFRHAAALALVGWYLMMPPLKPAPAIGVLANLPLSEWLAFLSYPNQPDCERARTARIYLTNSTMYNVSVPPNSGQIGAMDAVEQARQSLCVSDNDPRIDHARSKAEADARAAEFRALDVEPNSLDPNKYRKPPYVRMDPASHQTPKVVVSPLPH